MSSIAERVAAEHVFTSHSESLPGGRIRNSARCSCGHELPWTDRQEAHRSHVFAEHEAAVRAQIAADMAKVADRIAATKCKVDSTCHEADAITLRLHVDLIQGGAS